MADATRAERVALNVIEDLDDPVRLRNFVRNARRTGSTTVEAAAFKRLCKVQPAEAPGTLEHDLWQSIHALEEMLRDERGKTVRLSRTRQKIARDGEAKTAADLTLKSTPSEGFAMLLERGHPEPSFEAVVLRHPGASDDDVRRAAATRLSAFDLDPDQFTPGGI